MKFLELVFGNSISLGSWRAKGPAAAEYDLLGQRFEKMTSAFDRVSAVLATVSSAEGLVSDCRRAIESEFAERRMEQAELAALRAIADQAPLDVAAARESESAANMKLSDAVSELEALRTAKVTLDTRVGELEEEGAKLKMTMAGERKSAAELSRAVEGFNTNIAHLEADLATARTQVQELEIRRRDAEAAAAAAERARGMLDASHAALTSHHDQRADELLRTSQRLTEVEAALSLEQARASELAEELNASKDLSATLKLELEQQVQSAASWAQVAADRLETLQARTERQHEQISELARLVDDLTARERTAARETAEATLMRDRANERARMAHEKLAALETEAAAASTARQAAIARAEELTRAHQLNLAELGRLAESKTELRQALQQLNLRMTGEQSKAQNRISEISAELARERSERAVAEGALATLRKDRQLILNQLSRYDAGFAEPDGTDPKTAQSILTSVPAGEAEAGGTARRRGGAVPSAANAHSA